MHKLSNSKDIETVESDLKTSKVTFNAYETKLRSNLAKLWKNFANFTSMHSLKVSGFEIQYAV